MIAINTIVLAMDKYPGGYGKSLENLNYVFTTFFILEMLLKLLGLGLIGYFTDPYNIFDCVIVVSSAVDLIVSLVVQRESSSLVIAIRAFRLMRLFKLAK